MALADSNVLLRALQRAHPMSAPAWNALRILRERNELVFVSQNIVEAWVVATRPMNANGLAWSPSRAAAFMTRISAAVPVLVETPALHEEWKRLVVEHRVSGKNANDARIVAAMRVHCIQTLVTFNGDDFRRYPGIRIFHPRDVTGTMSQSLSNDPLIRATVEVWQKLEALIRSFAASRQLR